MISQLMRKVQYALTQFFGILLNFGTFFLDVTAYQACIPGFINSYVAGFLFCNFDLTQLVAHCVSQSNIFSDQNLERFLAFKISIILSVIFDSIVFILTLNRTYRALQEHKQNGIRSHLLHLLARDGKTLQGHLVLVD